MFEQEVRRWCSLIYSVLSRVFVAVEGSASRYCEVKESQHGCLILRKLTVCFSSTKDLLQRKKGLQTDSKCILPESNVLF